MTNTKFTTLSNTMKEYRPWGNFERFTLNEQTTVKILTVFPHQTLSLQFHHQRQEYWKFLDNPAKVTLGDRIIEVQKDDEVFIPIKTVHRIESYDQPVRVLEISFGTFDEDDIERIEDVYGRVEQKK